MKEKFLAIIAARAGSKRIPNKNIRLFNGKPLIYYSVRQALDSRLFDRVIVDTDAPQIAKVAKKYGAEVPFLRPKQLAGDKASIGDVLAHLLGRLRKEQGYVPDVIAILQPTSPLREMEDVRACYKVMSDPKIRSAATVCQTSPWLFHRSSRDNGLLLVNKQDTGSLNTQEVERGYMLNGAVFMCRTEEFMKKKRSVYFYDGETIGVVCPGWRSLDLDYPEDWVLAEFVHRNKKSLGKALKSFR